MIYLLMSAVVVFNMGRGRGVGGSLLLNTLLFVSPNAFHLALVKWEKSCAKSWFGTKLLQFSPFLRTKGIKLNLLFNPCAIRTEHPSRLFLVKLLYSLPHQFFPLTSLGFITTVIFVLHLIVPNCGSSWRRYIKR